MLLLAAAAYALALLPSNQAPSPAKQTPFPAKKGPPGLSQPGAQAAPLLPETYNSPTARYRRFMAAHPILSVDTLVKHQESKSTWVGHLILSRNLKSPPSVDWTNKEADGTYRFVSDGRLSLETMVTHSLYDLQRARPDGLTPSAISGDGGLAYPSVVVLGRLTAIFGSRVNLKPLGSSKTEDRYEFSGKSDLGTQRLELAMNKDGSIREYKIEVASQVGSLHLDYKFMNYKTGTAVRLPSFNTRPPTGLATYSFERPPAMLQTFDRIPSVQISGATAQSLGALLTDQPQFLVFTDDELSPQLQAALKDIGKRVPLLFISLDKRLRSAGGARAIATDSMGFDLLGVQATPQFYLVDHRKLVQAWLGFAPEGGATFSAEVLKSLDSIQKIGGK